MEFDRIPRIAKYLSLVYLLAWLGRSTVWNFLPIYIENHIASVFLVGVITSLPAALPIIMDIPVGNLIQRTGEKVVIFLGLVIGAIPPFLYFVALPVTLVFAKALEGVTKSLVWNGGWSINLKTPDSDVEAESLSVFLLGVNIAVIVGPVIGGYLIASQGFDVTFGLWVFTSLLSVLVFLSYIGLEGYRGFFDSLEELFHRQTYSNDWNHLKENWERLRFPYMLIFLYSVIFSFFWLAIPLFLDKLGADFVEMGLIFGAAALPKIFQYAFGDLADRLGKIKVIMISSLILTPLLVAMSFTSDVLLIGVLFFLARIFSSGISPPLHALFDSRCPDEVEAEMNGFNEFFKHCGQTAGPIMAGTVSSIWSLSASFLSAALISTAILGATFYVIQS